MKRLLLALFALSAGCNSRTPSHVGVFFGHYGSAVECIETKSDRSFRQVLIKDGAILYDNTGTWKPREDTDGIIFSDILLPVERASAVSAKSVSTLKIAPEKSASAMFTLWGESGERFINVMPGELCFLATDRTSPIKSVEQFAVSQSAERERKHAR